MKNFSIWKKCENYFNVLNSMITWFMANSLTSRLFWAGVLDQLTSQLASQGMCLDNWLLVLRTLPPKPSPRSLLSHSLPCSYDDSFSLWWLCFLPWLWASQSLRSPPPASAPDSPELELCHLFKEEAPLMLWHLVILVVIIWYH